MVWKKTNQLVRFPPNCFAIPRCREKNSTHGFHYHYCSNFSESTVLDCRFSSPLFTMLGTDRGTATGVSGPTRKLVVQMAQLLLVLFVGMFLGATRQQLFVSWRELSPANVWRAADQPCDSSGLAPIPALLQRAWIYDELNPAETKYAAEWFIKHAPFKVNSSMAYNSETGTAITGTEGVVLIPPPKAAARDYVDGVTNDPPPRMAKVVVARGLIPSPDVMEYMIGPLHGCNTGNCDNPSIDDDSPIVPLTKPGQIAFAKRPFDLSDDTQLIMSYKALKTLMPMLTAEFGKIWDWVPGRCPFVLQFWSNARTISQHLVYRYLGRMPTGSLCCAASLLR